MAQKSKASLTSTNNLAITDQQQEQNTSTRVRALVQDVIDSTFNLIDNSGSTASVFISPTQIAFGNSISGVTGSTKFIYDNTTLSVTNNSHNLAGEPPIFVADGGGGGLGLGYTSNHMYIRAINANGIIIQGGGAYGVLNSTNFVNVGSGYFGGTVTPTAYLDIQDSSTNLGSLRIRSGVTYSAITSPLDGLINNDGRNLFAYVGGTWQQLNNATGGTSNQTLYQTLSIGNNTSGLSINGIEGTVGGFPYTSRIITPSIGYISMSGAVGNGLGNNFTEGEIGVNQGNAFLRSFQAYLIAKNEGLFVSNNTSQGGQFTGIEYDIAASSTFIPQPTSLLHMAYSDNRYLKVTGTTITPNLNGKQIKNVAAATAATDVVIFSQLPISSGYSQTVIGTGLTTFTVAIGATQANTSYKVCVTPTSSAAAFQLYVSNKTTTTFDVVYTASIAGVITFDWQLIK